MDHKKAAQLAINVLCDLSNKHCVMCEWEQECSDNPLLFNPSFAKQYIKECKSWLINKQSVCAKCKLQMSKHLIDNEVQSDTKNAQTSPSAQNFDSFSSKELINLQNKLHEQKNQKLIKPSETFNQQHGALSENLINTWNNEIF